MIGEHGIMQKNKRFSTIMSYLIYECTNLRFDSHKRSYTGKITRTTSDDLVTAYLCSLFLCKSYSNLTLDYKSQFIIYPWIKLSATSSTQLNNEDSTDENI